MLLTRNGRQRRYLLHRLVLEAFAGPCPPGAQACHNNGDPTDNRLANLRWDTPSSNALDKQKHGTDHQRNKTHCPRGHLLQHPNLRAAAARRGRRSCLACHRAQAHTRRHPELQGQLQHVADNYYRALVHPET